jgi:redox-sensitive bicupin YhaK (pirin superfamily)
MAILANDGAGAVVVEAPEDARLILVAGKPLNEPIVQHGPFVMNTAEEIQQTLRDYREGKFNAVSARAL